MQFIQRASRFFKLRGFFIFTPLIIFLSCATVSPVNSPKESTIEFSTLDTVQPNWRSFADGVGFFHGKIASPRLEFWALEIDLSAPNVQIVVKGAAEGNLSAKVSSFVRDNDLVAGINAVPFDISSSREGQPIKNVGLVISDGELLSPANHHYDALIFYKDGSAAIVNQSAIQSIKDIENAVGGFHQILADGEPAQRTLNREERHPRSAAGVSANGSRLFLLVIDGRRAGSIGGTEKETALLLRALGAQEGINLDGGGSSALALRDSDGKVRTANTPIHNGIPGTERSVAGCIGIRLIGGDLTQRR